MILNDFEYHNTLQRIAGFKGALAVLNAPDNELKKTDAMRWQLNVEGVQSLLEDFSDQVEEYERLQNHQLTQPLMLSCDDILHLPRILIKARIAAHLSPQELADRVGMTEGQIQAFEKQDYQTATFAEMVEVFSALEVQLKQGEFSVGVERIGRVHQEINH
ncbi:helix-turn-helix domain-containing protein [Oscillatoria acuminata]|uniref:HTH cro/C1-type domain-containing protein n=1 Tax=Oscillatoria acuminata PCC 6304 TaxID=56110 RepID=K9TFE6_9CYAN|nr:helix-turn-helix transcriptional regulator [Oscillatoria acuminata]AFY80841.1 hypothetical protein Oscil6304_1114 [Oscillatoria acuminata PCC 6304]